MKLVYICVCIKTFFGKQKGNEMHCNSNLECVNVFHMCLGWEIMCELKQIETTEWEWVRDRERNIMANMTNQKRKNKTKN